MKWNFLNTTSFKEGLLKHSTTLSFVLLIFSFSFLYLSYQNLDSSSEKIKKIGTKKSEYYYLQQASDKMNHGRIEIKDFFDHHLSKINLLSDLKHRHDQSTHPSWPISFNPIENTLKHDVCVMKTRPFTHLRAKLVKKVFIDEEDLKQIFCLVESQNIFPYTSPSDSPYLYFSYFDLKKHSLKAFEKVYEVDYILEAFRK